ncbi:MAG: T9SS type A sorting domain-containing protein, partial [Opitutaceae bacterium]|nr:T9SS type A sorting domain-containing protein [Cytophagales bacterium]
GNTGNMSTSGYGSDHHMHFSHSNLIDNCYTENSGFFAYYRPYGTNPMHRITAAHTAFWNIASGGTKAYCVWTQQSRYGYAIGTSGVGSTVYTKENATGTASITDPVDIVEGEGLGATLSPQSLYLDQLAKRMITTSFQDSKTETNIVFYPNPYQDTFIIRNAENIKHMQVFDQNGKEIFTTANVKRNFGKDWIPGNYLIKLENIEGNVFFKRIEKLQ